MSNPFRAIGKVFSSVVKTVKKILPVVVAAGAIYFTAGAALGVTGAAGGWGAAVSNLTSQMGATGVLGKVLTGAVTQAGYGAAMGGLTSFVMGGDPVKGMTRGALTGAVTGGIMGGLGLQTDPLGGIGEKSAPAAGTAPLGPVEHIGSLPPPGLDATAIEAGVRDGLWTAPASATSATVGAAASAPAATATGSQAAGGGGLFSQGGWIERNQQLVGHAASGLGQGLMNMAQGDDQKAAARMSLERDREQRAAITANYGDGSVPGYRMAARQPGQMTPSQRFDPRLYQGNYQYDPQTGRIVWVPDQGAA